MKKLFENQKIELEKITLQQIKKDKNDDIKRKEREEAFENELNNMKNERLKQKNDFDKNLIEMKNKQEDVIKSGVVFKYHEIIKDIFNDIENYNKLKEDSKIFIIDEIIQNPSKIEDVSKNSLESRILSLKYLLDSTLIENQKPKIKEVDYIYKNIENCSINYDQIMILFKKK